MIIDQNDLWSNTKTQHIKSLLETFDYAKINYSPRDVVLIENQEMNKIMLPLENLISYCESNDIYDLGGGLRAICLSSDLEPDQITLTVHEENLIQDDFLLSIASELHEYHIPIYTIPIAESDIISQFGQYCLEQAEASGDYNYWIGFRFCALNEDNNEDDDSYYNVKDWMRDVPNAADRVEAYRNGTLATKGYISQKAADYIKNLLQTIDHEDPETIDRKIRGWMSETKFFKATNRDPSRRFDRGDIDNPETQKKIEDSVATFNRIKNSTERGGELLNSQAARKSENAFNMAKKLTLKRLEDVKTNAGGSDVEGTYDKDVASRVDKIYKMVDEEEFPKSWLAKKIAWLRSLYRNIMIKWTIQKTKGGVANGGVGYITGPLKTFAAFVLRCIDKLARKLQNAVNSK